MIRDCLKTHLPLLTVPKKLFYTLLLIISFSTPSFAASQISKISVISQNGEVRLKFDMNSEVKYRVYTTSKPEKLIVEFDESKLNFDLNKLSNPLFSSVKKGTNNQGQLRLTFYLKKEAKVASSTLIRNKQQYVLNVKILVEDTSVANTNGKKQSSIKETNLANLDSFSETVVNPYDDPLGKFIDEKVVAKKAEKESSEEVAQDKTLDKPQNTVAATSDAIAVAPITKPSVNLKQPRKTPIIIVDAGHGGKDSGTIGRFAGSKEKYVTLGYARELKRQLDQTKKYKVYLTRDKDFFIPLGERVARARRVKADLFVSVHADSSPDRDTSGLSIYTLSETSSDKQAEALAQKENKSDIIGGADFSNASADILKTLINMSQRSTMNESAKFAESVIKSIRENGVVTLQKTHRFAGFRVLTAPDIPSVLIELGYLSNKDEEKKLNNLHYKKKVVESIVEAVDDYFGVSSGMIPLSAKPQIKELNN